MSSRMDAGKECCEGPLATYAAGEVHIVCTLITDGSLTCRHNPQTSISQMWRARGSRSESKTSRPSGYKTKALLARLSHPKTKSYSVPSPDRKIVADPLCKMTERASTPPRPLHSASLPPNPVTP